MSGFPYTFPITLVWRQSELVQLDAYLKGQILVGISLDIFLGPAPLTKYRYMLEVREDDNLLAVLHNAFNINYSLDSAGMPTLGFQLPADCDKTVYLQRDREIWLRNLKTNAVMAKFRPQEQKERR